MIFRINGATISNEIFVNFALEGAVVSFDKFMAKPVFRYEKTMEKHKDFTLRSKYEAIEVMNDIKAKQERNIKDIKDSILNKEYEEYQTLLSSMVQGDTVILYVVPNGYSTEAPIIIKRKQNNRFDVFDKYTVLEGYTPFHATSTVYQNEELPELLKKISHSDLHGHYTDHPNPPRVEIISVQDRNVWIENHKNEILRLAGIFDQGVLGRIDALDKKSKELDLSNWQNGGLDQISDISMNEINAKLYDLPSIKDLTDLGRLEDFKEMSGVINPVLIILSKFENSVKTAHLFNILSAKIQEVQDIVYGAHITQENKEKLEEFMNSINTQFEKTSQNGVDKYVLPFKDTQNTLYATVQLAEVGLNEPIRSKLIQSSFMTMEELQKYKFTFYKLNKININYKDQDTLEQIPKFLNEVNTNTIDAMAISEDTESINQTIQVIKLMNQLFQKTDEKGILEIIHSLIYAALEYFKPSNEKIEKAQLVNFFEQLPSGVLDFEIISKFFSVGKSYGNDLVDSLMELCKKKSGLSLTEKERSTLTEEYKRLVAPLIENKITGKDPKVVRILPESVVTKKPKNKK